MKKLLISILLGAFLTGCGAVANVENVKKAPATGNQGNPQPAIKSPMSETASPQPAGPGSKGLVITVRPPMVPIAPVSGSGPAQGWQTFTSTALGVAVDYPSSWSAVEQADGVLFTSPGGATIRLQKDSSSNPPAEGQDCSTLINTYGQTGRLCVDTARSHYSAVFQKAGAGSTAWLSLSTVSSEKPTVFYQMFDSLRPAQ